MLIKEGVGIQVTNSQDIAGVFHSILSAEDAIERNKEHFWIALLDRAKRIKEIDLVSLGTNESTVIHPREVFRRAIAAGCDTVILCHNHPSGNSEASHDDIAITARLKDAGEIIGINVIDHIILYGDGFTSLAKQGLLKCEVDHV